MTSPTEVPGAYPVVAPVDVAEDVLVAVGGKVGKPLSAALSGQMVYLTNEASWLLAVPAGTKAFDELYAVGQPPFGNGLLVLSRTSTGNTLIGRVLTDRDHAGRAVVLLSVASIGGSGGGGAFNVSGSQGGEVASASGVVLAGEISEPEAGIARQTTLWLDGGDSNADTLNIAANGPAAAVHIHRDVEGEDGELLLVDAGGTTIGVARGQADQAALVVRADEETTADQDILELYAPNGSNPHWWDGTGAAKMGPLSLFANGTATLSGNPLGTRAAAVADIANPAAATAEACANKINALLAALRSSGLLAP